MLKTLYKTISGLVHELFLELQEINRLASEIRNKEKQKNTISVEDARKIVADLIIKVLTEQLCVRDALKSFPEDIGDPSIHSAWHALLHLEADEDLRKHDRLYADEQNEYLEMIAFTLKEGNPLPQNIINSYNEYYERALLPRPTGFINTLKSLMRFVNLK